MTVTRVLVAILVFIVLTALATGLLLLATPPDRVEPATTTVGVAWQPTNLPVPLTQTVDTTPVAQAARGPAIQLSEPPPAPVTVPTGLHGLPYAPDGLDNCDEMMFYATQAGLPAWFRQLGWRESNCRNEESVHTFCCWGYWQLYVSTHMADHRLAPRYAACGVSSRHDVDSNTPIDMQRQACAARAVLDVQPGAWS